MFSGNLQPTEPGQGSIKKEFKRNIQKNTEEIIKGFLKIQDLNKQQVKTIRESNIMAVAEYAFLCVLVFLCVTLMVISNLHSNT